MKIRVIKDDGTEETLTLSGSWRVREGKNLNRLVGPHGFVHFFSPSGAYDGWGAKIFREPDRVDADTAYGSAYRVFGHYSQH